MGPDLEEPVMKTMRWTALAVVIAIAGCAGSSGNLAPDEAEKQRVSLREMRDKSLKEFYATNPAIQAEIAAAAGYGVFDGSQVNLVLFVGATGAGVLTARDGAETFMTLKRVGTGPGAGYKNYRQLLVFK